MFCDVIILVCTVSDECGAQSGIVRGVVAINVEIRSSRLHSGRVEQLSVPVKSALIIVVYQVRSLLFCGLYDDTWFPKCCEW